MNITVLGAGAWGTALALVLSQNRHRVTLWGHDAGRLAEAASARENSRYLPGVTLPVELIFEADLAAAVKGADGVVVSVPSSAFREITEKLGEFRGFTVSTTKGIEEKSGLTMCQVLAETAPHAQVAALSGPSLAAEVARGVPTAVVAASLDRTVARVVQDLFHRPAFRVYTTTDLVGVELGGALKNVVAIAAGACDGLGFGDNTKAALITRGLAEIRRIGVACGAKPETFSGLSGIGDLTVTCFSKLSRNRGFGERLGKGEALDTVLASVRTAVEGHPTARSAHQLAQKLGVEAPITAEVHAALYEAKSPRRAVAEILTRETKSEE
ncbi:MAG TPA: NAD(P)H-dependent glycerol-3-phosphate dehydrogenase [Verrucomicrobiota bacterium]|nr:glycerol-3-phosphate dehydrogenase [Verrucomicrobiales bacterium]HRI13859.1 NAD(P)H-dependent glycerol-3-phosphate dehydrogenase [Verrucomicrobiota bacterium]